jgi:hypothetical protein
MIPWFGNQKQFYGGIGSRGQAGFCGRKRPLVSGLGRGAERRLYVNLKKRRGNAFLLAGTRLLLLDKRAREVHNLWCVCG